MDLIFDSFANKFSNTYQIPVFIMTAILELQQIIQNSTFTYDKDGLSIENGVRSNCSRKSVGTQNAEYVVGAYYIICLVVFSLLVKRVSFKRDQCHGRPGLVLAMNMLNSHNYAIEYTLVFLSLSEEIYNYIFGKSLEFGSLIPIIKFFIKLGLVFCFSVFFYPIFAAINARHLIGYSLVLVSTVAYFSIGISATYSAYFCVVGIKIVPLLFIAVVYSCIDLSIICLFIWKTVIHVLQNGCKNRQTREFEDRHFLHSLLYVKTLLKESFKIKSSNKTEIESNQDRRTESPSKEPVSEITEDRIRFLMNNFKCDELKSKVRRKMYLKIPGFTIPPRLIIGIAVGLYFAYRVFLDNIYDLTPVAWNLINNINNIYPSLNVTLQRAFMLVWANYSNYQTKEIQNAYRYLTLFYTHLLIGCLLCAIFIGFVNSIIQSFLLLRNYRLHFHKITRKGFSSLLNVKRAPDPYVLVLGFIRYSGFQAAFTLWGILVVTVFIFIVLYLLIGAFFLPLFFVENSWARQIVINYGPVLIATIIFNNIQSSIVKHVFVKEKGTLMEIDNRRAFMIYTHCAFFLNAMMGIFNSIKRVIIWLFTGAFCFQRIDFSALPDYLKGFDAGYMCYVGFIYTEQHHFNPILHCFANLLSESNNNKQNLDEINLEKLENERKRLRYRNLWHVSYTLINNKKLLIERKEYLRSNAILN